MPDERQLSVRSMFASLLFASPLFGGWAGSLGHRRPPYFTLTGSSAATSSNQLLPRLRAMRLPA